MIIFDKTIAMEKDEFSPLFEKLNEKGVISDENRRAIINSFEIIKVKKKEIILNAGEKCHHLYFVSEGFIRTYHLNKNGSEFTRQLAPEGSFCTILISLMNGTESPAYIEALENSTILKMHRSNFWQILESSPQLKDIYTQILEDFQNYQIQRLETLTQQGTAERIANFQEEFESYLERIPHKIAASFLQLTPETYSRCLNEYNND